MVQIQWIPINDYLNSVPPQKIRPTLPTSGNCIAMTPEELHSSCGRWRMTMKETLMRPKDRTLSGHCSGKQLWWICNLWTDEGVKWQRMKFEGKYDICQHPFVSWLRNELCARYECQVSRYASRATQWTGKNDRIQLWVMKALYRSSKCLLYTQETPHTCFTWTPPQDRSFPSSL